MTAYWSDIGKSLDLGCATFVFIIGHLDVQLCSSRLDGIYIYISLKSVYLTVVHLTPSGQAACEVNISGHAEISRVDDFIC